MKRWLLTALPLGLLCACSPAARADLAPPFPGPGPGPVQPGFRPGFGPAFAAKAVKLSVEVDEKAKQARLIVPMNLMFGGFLGPNPGRPNFPGRGGAPGGFGQGADARPLGLPTLVAGLALTLAAASGGLWLVRRRGGRVVAGILVVAMLGLGATVVWADGVPGFRPRPRPQPQPVVQATPLALPANIQLNGRILFELAPQGNSVRLIVPRSAVLAKEEKQAPGDR
jgi:hypothetical protein